MTKEFNREQQAKALAESLGLFITKCRGIYIVGNDRDEICKKYNMGYLGRDNIFYDKEIFVPDLTTGYIHLEIKDRKIVDASNIELPYGITNCSDMFRHCESLEIPPIIPDSVKKCMDMFMVCKSLKVAPIIPDSVEVCYEMFIGCNSLELPPKIPESVKDCEFMFLNCRSLKQKPIFPPNANTMFALDGTSFENSTLNAFS